MPGMLDLLPTVSTALNLALVLLGFGLIVFVHELGHFLAARWAGIRVLTFSIGFGPALLSYRRGLGIRVGAWSRAEGSAAGSGPGSIPPGHDPTEYRLSLLPLGGYVRMLGQDDLDPNARSEAPDSFQSVPVWKRMVVITAGVVFNLVAAAGLFVAVFLTGLPVEPPTIGFVAPDSPAATAIPLNGQSQGVREPGLAPGDDVVDIAGRRVEEFSDLVLASAMSRRGEPLAVTVRRPGVNGPLRFEIVPREDHDSKMLEIGVGPARSGTIVAARTPEDQQALAAVLARAGLGEVTSGMRLVRVGEQRGDLTAADLERACRHGAGQPVIVEFADPDGRVVASTIRPRAALQTGWVRLTPDSIVPVRHLLGLVPVMKVAPENGPRPRQGLQDGDVFVRLGTVAYPSIPAGIAEIRRHRGRLIPVVVQRGGEHITLDPPPRVHAIGGGQIGFHTTDTADDDTLLALTPANLLPARAGPARDWPGAAVATEPGMRIARVGDRPVRNFEELREALRAATAPAAGLHPLPVTPTADGEAPVIAVPLELEHPAAAGGVETPAVEHAALRLKPRDLADLHALGWHSPLDPYVFEPQTRLLRAQGPLDAVRMGLARTHRVMMLTYLTLVRLFEGTVKVEQLRGPVGIAHLGTRVAERGLVWLMFFIALISVNLAVINFLPLPIVDGGQFLFLVIEQIRGRPVPPAVLNAANVAGLILIVTVFVVVTFYDVARLFGS